MFLPSETRQYPLKLGPIIVENLWLLVHKHNSLVLSINLQLPWNHNLLQVPIEKGIHYLLLKTRYLIQLINDKVIKLFQIHIPHLINKRFLREFKQMFSWPHMGLWCFERKINDIESDVLVIIQLRKRQDFHASPDAADVFVLLDGAVDV